MSGTALCGGYPVTDPDAVVEQDRPMEFDRVARGRFRLGQRATQVSEEDQRDEVVLDLEKVVVTSRSTMTMSPFSTGSASSPIRILAEPETM